MDTKNWLPIDQKYIPNQNVILKKILANNSDARSQYVNDFMKIFDEKKVVLPPQHMDDIFEKMHPRLTTREKRWFFNYYTNPW